MNNEAFWRISLFLVALILIALWEAIEPKRVRKIPRQTRWPRNFGIILLDSVIIRLLAPFISAAAIALYIEASGFGILQWLALPAWLAILIAIILLDLAIYAQHVLFHWHPALWRLHMVHHIDQEMDVTTGIRFHPIEMIFSAFLKGAVVFIFGIPFLGLVIFEIILNAAAMFNHGNIRLPRKLDRLLRKVIVTPDMHRIHHSAIPRETHSNFGFNLSLWDYIFRTYRAHPELGHDDMKIGLEGYENSRRTGLLAMLTIPFTHKASGEEPRSQKTISHDQ